jgi:hypothetical protein
MKDVAVVVDCYFTFDSDTAAGVLLLNDARLGGQRPAVGRKQSRNAEQTCT